LAALRVQHGMDEDDVRGAYFKIPVSPSTSTPAPATVSAATASSAKGSVKNDAISTTASTPTTSAADKASAVVVDSPPSSSSSALEKKGVKVSGTNQTVAAVVSPSSSSSTTAATPKAQKKTTSISSSSSQASSTHSARKKPPVHDYAEEDDDEDQNASEDDEDEDDDTEEEDEKDTSHTTSEARSDQTNKTPSPLVGSSRSWADAAAATSSSNLSSTQQGASSSFVSSGVGGGGVGAPSLSHLGAQKGAIGSSPRLGALNALQAQVVLGGGIGDINFTHRNDGGTLSMLNMGGGGVGSSRDSLDFDHQDAIFSSLLSDFGNKGNGNGSSALNMNSIPQLPPPGISSSSSNSSSSSSSSSRGRSRGPSEMSPGIGGQSLFGFDIPPPQFPSPQLSNPSQALHLGSQLQGQASPSLIGGGGGGASVSPQDFSYELTDEDSFEAPAILRFSLTFPLKQQSSSISSTPIPIYKGILTSTRGNENVSVFVWRKNLSLDATRFEAELKELRLLASSCRHVARIMHNSLLDVRYPPNSGQELSCIVSEYSEYGSLEQFVQSNAEGISLFDLQTMCTQLIDAFLHVHSAQICHRDVRPRNVLVTRGDRYQPRTFGSGLVLKLTDFRISSLYSGPSTNSSGGLRNNDIVLDMWVAPEVDSEMLASGIGYAPVADNWSLGLLLYYIATNGKMPFSSYRQAQEAISNAEQKKLCLEQHDLHTKIPMLADLVERLVRPAQMRGVLSQIRCHPFLWSLANRKKMIIEFANVTAASSHQPSSALNAFVEELERYGPNFVYPTTTGAKEAWVNQMSGALLAHVQPVVLKEQYWWSCKALLHAIRNQLIFPESIHASVYPQLTYNKMMIAYLRQVVDRDFPKLLIIIYELGARHGRWSWDRQELSHRWNI